VGIPAENLERIFEPLFSTKTRGIGLGLAITRAIVERNGGPLSVTSQLGFGSTFVVELNFAE
jgi:two-component system sensor kinase FixL